MTHNEKDERLGKLPKWARQEISQLLAESGRLLSINKSLLEALEAIERDARLPSDGAYNANDRAAFQIILETARDAIAKARGES